MGFVFLSISRVFCKINQKSNERMMNLFWNYFIFISRSAKTITIHQLAWRFFVSSSIAICLGRFYRSGSRKKGAGKEPAQDWNRESWWNFSEYRHRLQITIYQIFFNFQTGSSHYDFLPEKKNFCFCLMNRSHHSVPNFFFALFFSHLHSFISQFKPPTPLKK